MNQLYKQHTFYNLINIIIYTVEPPFNGHPEGTNKRLLNRVYWLLNRGAYVIKLISIIFSRNTLF